MELGGTEVLWSQLRVGRSQRTFWRGWGLSNSVRDVYCLSQLTKRVIKEKGWWDDKAWRILKAQVLSGC